MWAQLGSAMRQVCSAKEYHLVRMDEICVQRIWRLVSGQHRRGKGRGDAVLHQHSRKIRVYRVDIVIGMDPIAEARAGRPANKAKEGLRGESAQVASLASI